MTKIQVFSSHREASQELSNYFAQNKKIVGRIFNRLYLRQQEYQQTPQFKQNHPGNKEAVFSPEEMKMLCNNLGQGETVTSMFKLYAFGLQEFGFDYTVFNPNHALNFVPHYSMAALTEKAQQQIKEEQNRRISLKTMPLFYTVLEPFTYSEKEKMKARKDFQYPSLSTDEKRILDYHLDTYLERALTPTEIQEFVSGYEKFLN